jgi:hypothetical protein
MKERALAAPLMDWAMSEITGSNQLLFVLRGGSITVHLQRRREIKFIIFSTFQQLVCPKLAEFNIWPKRIPMSSGLWCGEKRFLHEVTTLF